MTKHPPTGKLGYSLVALGLGLLWFLALLIPPSTSAFLTVPEWWNFQLRWFEQLGLMCLASLSVAVLFRPLIVTTHAWPRRFALAAVLPLAGTVLFVWATIVLALLTGRLVIPDGANPKWVQLLSLTFFMGLHGLLYAVIAVYVVLPMGLLSQLIMERVGRLQFEKKAI